MTDADDLLDFELGGHIGCWRSDVWAWEINAEVAKESNADVLYLYARYACGSSHGHDDRCKAHLHDFFRTWYYGVFVSMIRLIELHHSRAV